jgi:hypothetical protein
VTASGTGSLITVRVASGVDSRGSVGFDAGDSGVTGDAVDVGAGKVSANVGKTIAVPGWQADTRMLVAMMHANVAARMDRTSRRGIYSSSQQWSARVAVHTQDVTAPPSDPSGPF